MSIKPDKSWHKIGTAPKDGTRILAIVYGRTIPIEAWFENGEWLCDALIELREEDRLAEIKFRSKAVNAFQRRAPTPPPYEYNPTHWKHTTQSKAKAP